MNTSTPQEELSGLIERVTFHSEETGFAVLRIKVKGHRELVTVVGALANVNAGEWITAQGNWVQDKEHGLQFKATFLKCSPPRSREGIEKYLASGLIKGIGPVSEILTSFRINLSLFGEKSGGDLWSGKGSLTLSKTGTDVRRHGLARGCPDDGSRP